MLLHSILAFRLKISCAFATGIVMQSHEYIIAFRSIGIAVLFLVYIKVYLYVSGGCRETCQMLKYWREIVSSWHKVCQHSSHHWHLNATSALSAHSMTGFLCQTFPIQLCSSVRHCFAPFCCRPQPQKGHTVTVLMVILLTFNSVTAWMVYNKSVHCVLVSVN